MSYVTFWVSRCSLLTTAGLLVSGCASTIEEQKRGQLTVLRSSVAIAEEISKAFSQGSLPPQHDLHFFLSYKPLNEALAGINQFEFSPSNDPSIKVRIDTVRLVGSGASPVVEMKATASRGSITVGVEIGALLAPAETSDGLRLRPVILSFVPTVKWFVFEPTKAEFVRALLSIELAKIAERLPAIELPVAQLLEYGSPARTSTITIPTRQDNGVDVASLTMQVDFPSTLQKRRIRFVKYVFLPTGIHVFGELI